MRFPLVLLLFLTVQATAAPKKLFLSIGINNYSPEEFHTLRFAEKDAEDIANALKAKFDGGILLTGTNTSNQRVTKADILAEFDKLAKENQNEDDIILVYISAHGTVGRRADGKIEKYLASSDSIAKSIEATAISHVELNKIFNGLRSKRKVLIFDSCYSGGGKSRLTKSIMEQLARSKGTFFKEPDIDPAESTMILTASAWGEEAAESPELKNGIYTHFLIRGFDRDYNGDGAVSITEAHEYATQKVVEFTRNAQNPTARLEMVGQDPIIIRGDRSSGQPQIFAYEWITRKLGVEINGTKMGNLSKGGLLVPEGLQRLVLSDEAGKVLVDRHFRFEKGQEYSLSNFIHDNPAWNFRVSTWNGALLNNRQSSRFIPSIFQGFQIELMREEVAGSYDLQGRFLYIPPFQSEIKTLDGYAKQSAEGARGAVLIGKHRKSNAGKSTDWALYTAENYGLGTMYIRRAIDDVSFFDKKQYYFAPGIVGSIEGGLEALSARLQIGLRLSAEAYQTAWDFSQSVQAFGAAEIVVGYIW